MRLLGASRHAYYVVYNTLEVIRYMLYFRGCLTLSLSFFFFLGGVMCVFSLHEVFHNHLSARCPLTTSKIILYVDRVYFNFNFNFLFASLLLCFLCFSALCLVYSIIFCLEIELFLVKYAYCLLYDSQLVFAAAPFSVLLS